MGQQGSRGAEPIPQGPDEAPNNPEATWWCRLFARIVGGIGGIGRTRMTVGPYLLITISLLY